MKRTTLVIAALLAAGLAGCGDKQKPAATPSVAPAKPEGAAPPPPPPPPPADMKADQKK